MACDILCCNSWPQPWRCSIDSSFCALSLCVPQPLPAELRERVCNAFVDNENRDTDDRRRYVELYGTHELLDYRSATLYDIRIDTTTNTPQQTFEQAMKALQAVGIK